MTRPSWVEQFLDIAHVTARRSTCPRRKVGAVIANTENQILASGYNGSPRGLIHCTDIDEEGIERGAGCFEDLDGSCRRAVHAEMNAIVQAARVGVPLAGSILYLTHRPCIRCVGPIIQAGIFKIVYREEFRMDETYQEIADRLSLAGVSLLKYEYTTGRLIAAKPSIGASTAT
jgi:dCMP deaminase